MGDVCTIPWCKNGIVIIKHPVASMSFKKSLVLICTLLATHCVGAQTVTQVFGFAEATYPSLFAGTPVSGTYLQYTYRYYPTSKNYLAVDNSNVISLLGPASGNVILAIGPVSAFSGDINAWVAKQTPGVDVSTAVKTVCPTQTGLVYSSCSGSGSNTAVSFLDPIYTGSFKNSGTVTSSTQPGVSVGSACSLAIETFFGIFVAKVGTTTNAQVSFQGRSTDAITLSSSGTVDKIYVTDSTKGQTVEVRTVNGGAEFTSSITNSTQSIVCKVK
jgi:hypothetical protein